VIWSNGKPLEWIVEGSKADGDKFESRKRIELQTQGDARRSAILFSDLCKEYALHAEAHLKESTWKKVRVYQVATLSEHLGSAKTDKLTVGAIDRFKARRRETISAASVNNELRVLRRILNWAKRAGYAIPDLPFEKYKSRTSDRVKFWTLDELEKIFAATRQLYPDLLPMLLFLANTGCRKGEALAAEWRWIDFDAGLIRVEANEYWQPKNGHSRDVPMSDSIRAVLSCTRKHPTVVFPNRNGRRFTDFPKDSFWAILKRTGVRGNPHMFRHTFASNFLAAVPDMQLLAEILGHSTTRVTEIYAHLLPGRLDRAKNAVNLAPRTMVLTMAKDTRKRIKARQNGQKQLKRH
jgi:integrase